MSYYSSIGLRNEKSSVEDHSWNGDPKRTLLWLTGETATLPESAWASTLVPFLNHEMRGGLSPARTVFDIRQRRRSSLPSCTKRSFVPPGITANDSATRREERGYERFSKHDE